ncbi:MULTISPECIES: GNAT family N-acetyltransferase [unclassified Microbulbifer]|uniref:GNAT family N-acetyltransferase n=1 Tax=unclassified Microbulbifer TaxID=2619833 RepID=UPI0027E5280E|nr:MULTISPECIES: GNAT family N-acetyltransferase [unclassified Microbulbifer]
MIRAVCGDDWDVLEQLWLKVVCDAHPSVPRSYWEGQSDYFRQSCLQGNTAWVYQDSESREITGLVALGGDDQLATLFVVPWARDRGTGSALMARAKQGRSLLWVVVLEENLLARYFCQKHHFVEVDREACGETGQNRLLMEFRCE